MVTDGDVEIAARAIFESVRHSGTRWEDLKPYPRENYRQMARAVLESVDVSRIDTGYEAALSEAVGRAERCPVDWRTALYDALSGVNTDAGAVVIDFEELCKDPAYHREDVRAGRLASEVEEAKSAFGKIAARACTDPDSAYENGVCAVCIAREALSRLDGEKAE